MLTTRNLNDAHLLRFLSAVEMTDSDSYSKLSNCWAGEIDCELFAHLLYFIN